MTAQSVLCTVADGVAVVTLNNPPLNLVTLAMTRELNALVTRLAARMTVLGGQQPDEASALQVVTAAIGSGAALDVFRRMVEQQGGDPRVVDDPGLLPAAPAGAWVNHHII